MELKCWWMVTFRVLFKLEIEGLFGADKKLKYTDLPAQISAGDREESLTLFCNRRHLSQKTSHQRKLSNRRVWLVNPRWRVVEHIMIVSETLQLFPASPGDVKSRRRGTTRRPSCWGNLLKSQGFLLECMWIYASTLGLHSTWIILE